MQKKKKDQDKNQQTRTHTHMEPYTLINADTHTNAKTEDTKKEEAQTTLSTDTGVCTK